MTSIHSHWNFVDLEYYSFNYVDTTRTEWH